MEDDRKAKTNAWKIALGGFLFGVVTVVIIILVA